MFYNDTRRQMKELAYKIMSGNRRRNAFVIIAVAMTTFLISTILCIGSGYFCQKLLDASDSNFRGSLEPLFCHTLFTAHLFPVFSHFPS